MPKSTVVSTTTNDVGVGGLNSVGVSGLAAPVVGVNSVGVGVNAVGVGGLAAPVVGGFGAPLVSGLGAPLVGGLGGFGGLGAPLVGGVGGFGAPLVGGLGAPVVGVGTVGGFGVGGVGVSSLGVRGVGVSSVGVGVGGVGGLGGMNGVSNGLNNNGAGIYNALGNTVQPLGGVPTATDVFLNPNSLFPAIADCRNVGLTADIRTVLACLIRRGHYVDMQQTPYGPTEYLILNQATHFLWNRVPGTNRFLLGRDVPGVTGQWSIVYSRQLGTWTLENIDANFSDRRVSKDILSNMRQPFRPRISVLPTSSILKK